MPPSLTNAHAAAGVADPRVARTRPRARAARRAPTARWRPPKASSSPRGGPHRRVLRAHLAAARQLEHEVGARRRARARRWRRRRARRRRRPPRSARAGRAASRARARWRPSPRSPPARGRRRRSARRAGARAAGAPARAPARGTRRSEREQQRVAGLRPGDQGGGGPQQRARHGARMLTRPDSNPPETRAGSGPTATCSARLAACRPSSHRPCATAISPCGAPSRGRGRRDRRLPGRRDPALGGRSLPYRREHAEYVARRVRGAARAGEVVTLLAEGGDGRLAGSFSLMELAREAATARSATGSPRGPRARYRHASVRSTRLGRRGASAPNDRDPGPSRQRPSRAVALRAGFADTGELRLRPRDDPGPPC